MCKYCERWKLQKLELKTTLEEDDNVTIDTTQAKNGFSNSQDKTHSNSL